jgi:hypothetical protein
VGLSSRDPIQLQRIDGVVFVFVLEITQGEREKDTGLRVEHLKVKVRPVKK